MSTIVLQSPYPIALVDVFKRVQKKTIRAIKLNNHKNLVSLFKTGKYDFRIIKNKFGEEIIKHFIKVPREERNKTNA